MYLKFFNLRELPFRLTPDPKFLHFAEPQRVVLTQILEGVVFRKGFVLVTGPVGTGKTTLVHTALQFLHRRLYVKNSLLSAFLVNPTLTRDELLESLIQEFELKCAGTSKPARLAALHQAFLARFRAGGTSVVFIDEAHLLSSEILEELRLLNNVDTYKEKLLQIVLVGQPELLNVLDRTELAALRQRVAARCKLRPLTPAECRVYIAERLRAAGLANGPFNSEALEEIHRISDGIPRLINLICDRTMIMACEQRCQQITPEIVESAAEFLGVRASDYVMEAQPKRPRSVVAG